MNIMNIRLQSRIIAINNTNDKIILVRNPGKDFWYLPGGGLESDEDIQTCAIREMKEETGLNIELGKLMYAQELHDQKTDTIHSEFMFLAKLKQGEIFNEGHQDEAPDGIAEAKWFSQKDIQKVTAYPERLRNSFWSDLEEINKREDPFIGVFY